MTLALALLDGEGPLTAGDLSRAGAPIDGSAADAVTAVLDEVASVLRDDPGFAGRVLERLRLSLDILGVASAAPTVAYLLVQVFMGEGRLSEALAYTETARDGYLANGDEVQSIRTNLGRANVLNDMGRYDEALVANALVLDAAPRLLAAGADALLVGQLSARAHAGRADCYELVGRYDEALLEFDAAERDLVRVGDVGGAADVVHNRACVLMDMGRVAEGTEELRRAAGLFERDGSRLRLAGTRISIAAGHIEMGEHAAALDVLAAAGSMLDEIDNQQWRYEHGAARGDAYLALNLVQEAIDEYRDIHKWASRVEFALERARTSYALGRALARLGDREAQDVLAEAVEAFRALGHASWAARGLVALGTYEAGADSTDLAAQHLLEAADVARASGVELESLRARMAYTAMRGATVDDHRALYDEAVLMGLPPLVRDAAHLAGRRALADGDVATARQFFGEASAIDEQRRVALGHESLMVGLGSDELASDLVRLELAPGGGGVSSAIHVADRGKSRSLLELAAGACRRGNARDEASSAVERDLHAAYRQMFEAADDVARFDEVRRRAKDLEGQLRRQQLTRVTAAGTGERSLPAGAEPVGPDGNSLVEIAYSCLGDEIVAFVRSDGAVHALRLPIDVAGVRALLARLDAQHGRLRLGDGFATRNAARLELACRGVLGALHEGLVAPLAGAITADLAVTPVLVAPHGPLHAVPFHALWDGERYLVDRWSCSVTPSLAVYATCAIRNAAGGNEASSVPLVVGLADDLAPCAEDEARDIAESTGGDLLVGSEATVANVRTLAAGRSLVHIATHAWHRSDNAMFSAIRLADRWLTAADVLDDFDLGGATVVLSACDTGRSTAAGGDELLGLTRGFLGAGARSLLVSLWPTHDSATHGFMGEFHRRLPNCGAAEALRHAQLAAKAATSHPTLWAPFTLVGAR